MPRKSLPNTEKTDHFSNEISPESVVFEVDFIAKIRTSPFGMYKFLGGKRYVREFP